jgi:hypothetical protein
MGDIDKDIAKYENLRARLEAKSMGKWVLIHDAQLISIHDTFEATAESAVGQFGQGPYLIRQVGAPPVTLPASVMFRPQNG